MGYNHSMLGALASEKLYRQPDIDYFVVRRPSDAEGNSAILRKIRAARLAAYKRAGKVSESNIDDFFDQFDETQNVYHVIGVQNEQICAGLRIHVYKPRFDQIPTASVFPEEFEEFFKERSALDHTRFFVARSHAGQNRAIHFNLFCRSFELAADLAVDVALAPVVKSHSAFYRRFLNFTEVSKQPVSYPPFGIPHVLMAMSFHDNAEEATKRYPDYFAGSAGRKLRQQGRARQLSSMP